VASRQVVHGIRTGGRSARIREAIHAAVLDELIERGYAALSVESVASRAGVNKTTVYRRWPTLDELLLDALTSWASDAFPVPETGSIETDLLALGKELASQLNGGIGRELAAIVLTAGLRSAQLGEAARQYFDHQAMRAAPVVNRAIDRGELPAGTDPNALLATIRAPLFYRMVTTGDPIDGGLITRAVGIALNAARAGLLSE
jgi:AcrR family transcriptional regulator